MLKRIVLDWIFPRICIGCWSSWSYLCAQCKKLLRPHPELCPFSHQASPWYRVRQDLLTIASPLDGCIVLFRFEPLIKKLIRQLKYYHRGDIASFLGERLALAVQSHEVFSKLLDNNGLLCSSQWQQFIISYVPAHWYRHYIVKGYNQSKLLAQSLSSFLPNSSFLSLFKKTKHTHSQVWLSREERKTNLSDAFTLRRPLDPGSVVIIVDDVLTSGATLAELASTIKKSQPDCQVWGLCVARNG